MNKKKLIRIVLLSVTTIMIMVCSFSGVVLASSESLMQDNNIPAAVASTATAAVSPAPSMELMPPAPTSLEPAPTATIGPTTSAEPPAPDVTEKLEPGTEPTVSASENPVPGAAPTTELVLVRELEPVYSVDVNTPASYEVTPSITEDVTFQWQRKDALNDFGTEYGEWEDIAGETQPAYEFVSLPNDHFTYFRCRMRYDETDYYSNESMFRCTVPINPIRSRAGGEMLIGIDLYQRFSGGLRYPANFASNGNGSNLGWVQNDFLLVNHFKFFTGVRPGTLRAAVWNDATSGQDDLIWYTGIYQGAEIDYGGNWAQGRWDMTGGIGNHRSQYGNFVLHFYAQTYSDGAAIFYGSRDFSISWGPVQTGISGGPGKTVNQGQNVTFSNSIMYSENLNFDSWQYSTDASNWINFNGTLNAQPWMNGLYIRRYTKNGNNSWESQSEWGRLWVRWPPSITKHPTARTVNEGQSVSFSIGTSQGNPGNSYQWQEFNGSSWYNVWASGYNTPTMTFNTARALNGYQYRCYVHNGVWGIYSNGAQLTVNYAPTITSNPVARTVNEGVATSFSVDAGAGNPAATTYQWQQYNGSAWSNIVGATRSTYNITPTKTQNGYKYRCYVANSALGVYSAAAALTVQYIPAITKHPSNVTIPEGESASFLVIATAGNPAATSYQWQQWNGTAWTNISEATRSTYTFTPTRTHNEYQYRCYVSNTTGGIHSAAATLTVQDSGEVIIPGTVNFEIDPNIAPTDIKGSFKITSNCFSKKKVYITGITIQQSGRFTLVSPGTYTDAQWRDLGKNLSMSKMAIGLSIADSGQWDSVTTHTVYSTDLGASPVLIGTLMPGNDILQEPHINIVAKHGNSIIQETHLTLKVSFAIE